ncbi:MAG: DUF6089 family protein [Chitinophagaceae bacterium]|nr:DUF6089 family protein [Chitinophagaceae bacterium]
MKKLIILLLCIPCFSFAQEKHHEMGIFGGTSNYFGDLQPKLFPNNSYAPVGGLLYKYFVNPRVGFRFGASYTELTAADSLSEIATNRLRNLNFTTNLFEFHSAVEVNLLKVDPMYRRFSPYIFGGVSVFYFNPYTGDANDEKVYLKPLATEGQGLPTYTDRKNYNLVNFAVPMGGGMKVLIGKKVLVSAEMGFRFTMTDYLDDVSKSFVNMDTLYAYKGRQSVDLSFRRDEIKGWERDYPSYGYQRGDKRSYDMYWFGGIGVTLYFDSFGNLWPYGPSKCPKKNSMW